MKPKVLLAAIVLLVIAAIIGLKEAKADPNPPEAMATPSPYPRLWKWCGVNMLLDAIHQVVLNIMLNGRNYADSLGKSKFTPPPFL